MLLDLVNHRWIRLVIALLVMPTSQMIVTAGIMLRTRSRPRYDEDDTDAGGGTVVLLAFRRRSLRMRRLSRRHGSPAARR